MKYDFWDSKLSQTQLEEIYSMGGIASPQDGSFRFREGTVDEEYIKEKESRGYRVRRSRDYVEFSR